MLTSCGRTNRTRLRTNPNLNPEWNVQVHQISTPRTKNSASRDNDAESRSTLANTSAFF